MATRRQRSNRNLNHRRRRKPKAARHRNRHRRGHRERRGDPIHQPHALPRRFRRKLPHHTGRESSFIELHRLRPPAKYRIHAGKFALIRVLAHRRQYGKCQIIVIKIRHLRRPLVDRALRRRQPLRLGSQLGRGRQRRFQRQRLLVRQVAVQLPTDQVQRVLRVEIVDRIDAHCSVACCLLPCFLLPFASLRHRCSASSSFIFFRA